MVSALRSTISRERWPIVAFLLAGIALAALIVAAMPPVYTATARSYVSSGSSSHRIEAGGAPDPSGAHVVASYADVATGPIVLDRVVQRLRLPSTSRELARQIRVEVASEDPVIRVSVTDGSADRAAAIANGVLQALAESTSSSTARTASTTEAETKVKITMIQSASVPSGPADRFLLPALLMGSLIGLLVAAGWVLLRIRRPSA